MFSVGSSGEWSEQFVNKFDDIEISACDTKEGDVGCSARVGGKRKTQNIDTVQSVPENGEKKVGNCEVVAIGQNAKSNRVKSAWESDDTQNGSDYNGTVRVVSKQFCTINSADT